MTAFSALHLTVLSLFCQITGATYTAPNNKTVTRLVSEHAGISLPAEPSSRPVELSVHSITDPNLVIVSVVEFNPTEEQELLNTRRDYRMKLTKEGSWTAAVKFQPGKVYHLTAAAVDNSSNWKSSTITLNVANN